ncbi:MAG: hypothetical protein AAFV53_09875 [Myxococcota bacterium]
MLIFAFLLTASTPGFAAERADVVRKKLEEDDFESARKRCEKWEAWTALDDRSLREACAESFWPLAEVDDSAVGWAAYRKRWAGTPWSTDAYERLASATLRELPETSSEDILLKLADDFPDTRAASSARERAADAAVRDAGSGEAAVAVARRYPTHPGIAPLVEKFPDHFLRVQIADEAAKVVIDPPVQLPDFMTPRVEWVARWPGGQTRPWSEVAGEQLTQAGLTETWIRAAASGKADDAPALPLCALPGQPDGWHAAAVVHVGAGRYVEQVDWFDGCQLDDPPVVFTVAAGQVTGLSLKPGHRVDLASRTYQDRPNTRAFAPIAQGAPKLARGQLYLTAGRIWVVYPMNGGPPWMTDRAPPLGMLPVLSTTLRGTRPPAGWSLSRQGDAMVLINPKDRGSRWEMPLGEVRFLSPLMQRVLDISPAALAQRDPETPPITAAAGWTVDRRNNLVSAPPQGAIEAPVQAITGADLDDVQKRVISAGLSVPSMEILDAWAMDLDLDGEMESVLRLRAQSRGILAVLDVHPEYGNRLFVFGTNHVATATGPAAPPFGFSLHGRPYLAWAGISSPKENYIETVRYDGVSFRLDPIMMPR